MCVCQKPPAMYKCNNTCKTSITNNKYDNVRICDDKFNNIIQTVGVSTVTYFWALTRVYAVH